MDLLTLTKSFMCLALDFEYPLRDLMIREIKHDFLFINISKVPREVLKSKGEGRGFQQFPRVFANVN